MESLIIFLNKWQTLIGSFIGGIVGLLAALLVAYKERRRDENASAMLLISDLTVFTGASSEVINSQSDKDTDKGKVIIAHKLVRLRPILSPMFDASMVRVMSVDQKLAAHLANFKMLYTGITQILDRLAPQFDKEDISVLVDNTVTIADAKKLYQGLDLASKQAECAVYFLEELFLRGIVWWARNTISFRRRFCPTSEDKKSETLLKEAR